MAVPTWPLWLGVIFITGAQLTLENAANSSPPRKGEAIALDAAPFSGRGGEGRRAPQGGQRSSIAPPTGAMPCSRRTRSFPPTGRIGELRPSTKAIGAGRFRIARDSTRLDFAPIELVPAPQWALCPDGRDRRDKSRESFAPVTSCRILDGLPLQSKQPAPRWMS